MNNIKRHEAEIKRVREEIKKANPKGFHIRDLKRYLNRLLKEKRTFEHLQKAR